jgi:predicted DNA-binding helix-hairpin-helix protein
MRRTALHLALKILLTNSCIFDCHYCINRKSSNVRRARFTAEEVVSSPSPSTSATISRGCSSPRHHPLLQLHDGADRRGGALAARGSRFRGYIHLKTIPDADPELVRQAGLHADRVSINVELPTDAGLRRLAPEKDGTRIEGAMKGMRTAIEDGADAKKRFKSAPSFAPAGQSTQMIVGADSANDSEIVSRASGLYDRFKLRRVYYSAFSPIPDASAVLPLQRPPLMREHRLYQSDWLMRFYGFKPAEVVQATDTSGNLPLDMDPKLAWALKFRENFPVDVNRAPRELLLRVPGLGVKAVDRIVASRRWRRLSLDDVARLTLSVAKVRPFIIADGWRPTLLTDRVDLKQRIAPKKEQLELFAA